MTINDHFDIAHHLGHSAMHHLGQAASVYDTARGLFDLAAHDWPACLGVSGTLKTLRDVEERETICAVVLFQAMMEKLPQFLPSLGVGLAPSTAKTFAGTWQGETDKAGQRKDGLLDQIKDPGSRAAALAAFATYNTSIYKAFRNPISHGKLATDVADVAKIRFPAVHNGLRQGWAAYDALIAEGLPGHQPSWNTLCEAHGTPPDLDLKNYRDLGLLSRDFAKKHLDGARAAAGQY